MKRSIGPVLVVVVFTICSAGQVLTVRPPESSRPSSQPSGAMATPSQPQSIPLTVPAGTPLKVALEKEVRVRRVGQEIRAKLVEPVYAFDKLVVPAGTEVVGKVADIEGVSKKNRTLAAMNANFSPARQVRIEFNELQLAGSRARCCR